MCVRDAGVTWEKKFIQRLALKGVALQCLKCFVSLRDTIENAELANSTNMWPSVASACDICCQNHQDPCYEKGSGLRGFATSWILSGRIEGMVPTIFNVTW